jgi:hypothetical protein
MTVVRELARYRLDLVCVQEITWDKEGTARAGNSLFSMEKGMKINKCTVMFQDQNARQDRNIKTGNKSSETVEQV